MKYRSNRLNKKKIKTDKSYSLEICMILIRYSSKLKNIWRINKLLFVLKFLVIAEQNSQLTCDLCRSFTSLYLILTRLILYVYLFCILYIRAIVINLLYYDTYFKKNMKWLNFVSVARSGLLILITYLYFWLCKT